MLQDKSQKELGKGTGGGNTAGFATCIPLFINLSIILFPLQVRFIFNSFG